ncbi:MAG TPA: DUF3052 domain-containing protein [Solirubrobacteraceae bacterium]
MSPSGYSGTPLHKKLGLKAGSRLTLIGAPAGWSVPELPPESKSRRARTATFEARVQGDVGLAFFKRLVTLRSAIGDLGERIHPDGALWVAWPRRAGGHVSDISEQDIRDVALPLGLVDVKVAALDEDWSGLRLVWRRERR